jgi:NTE family protein
MTGDGPESRRRAFVLGGGGRWGAVQLGMLRALDEAGVRPDLVVGTSIGAINGALYAAEPGSAAIDSLDRLWREAASADLMGGSLIDRAKAFAKLRIAVLDQGDLRDLLDRELSVDRIEDLAVSFQCVAASIERAAEHWFDRGPIVDAILASCAVPAMFPPVEIDGEHFYDGGLVNSVPVDRAIELGANEIYVLQVGRIENPLRPPERLYETALVAFEIARRHRLASLRERTIPGVSIHLLPSANDLEFDDRRQFLWSDMDDTGDLAAGAYEASQVYLAEQRSR